MKKNNNNVKIDEAFFKEGYKKLMTSLVKRIEDGNADSKEMTLFLNEIKRHEMKVLDEEENNVTSFTKSKDRNIIGLPNDLDLKQG